MSVIPEDVARRLTDTPAGPVGHDRRMAGETTAVTVLREVAMNGEVYVAVDPAGEGETRVVAVDASRITEAVHEAAAGLYTLREHIQHMVDTVQAAVDNLTPAGRETFNAVRERIRRQAEENPGLALIGSGVAHDAVRWAADRQAQVARAEAAGLVGGDYARRLYEQATVMPWNSAMLDQQVAELRELDGHWSPTYAFAADEISATPIDLEEWRLGTGFTGQQLAANDELIAETRAAFPHDPHQYGYPGNNPMRWQPPEDEDDETRRAHP